MKVNLRYEGDYQYVGTNENGNEVHIDMLPAEEKKHQTPVEMLLSSLAACASVDLVSMIKKRRRTFLDLKVSVDGERREEHPRGFTKINLKFTIFSPDLTDEEAEKFVALSAGKYCSVAGSLSAEQTHEVEVIRM